MRVAVIFHRFGPYHFARLKAASEFCDVSAVELVAETTEYAWARVEDVEGIKRITLFPKDDPSVRSAKQNLRRIDEVLSSCKANAIAIPGWSNKGAIAALDWCARTGTTAILMSESTAEDEPRTWWKEFIKRRIAKLYSSALVGGQRHVDYLIELGMRRDRIFTGYDVVDNDHFARRAKEVRSQAPEVRQKYKLPDNYFLASARFIAKKNLFTLLRAYADYHSSLVTRHLSPWSLILLGDGPLKSDLCRLISDLGLEDSVALPGFKQYDELPVYYGLASAFVHASTTEQWGLVVNEAMASALPVIVSNRCGCAPELVVQGENGFTFDPDDPQELAARLLVMSAMPKTNRERFALASSEIAAGFQATRFGQGLKRAAELAVSLPPKSATFLDRALLSAVMWTRP